MAGGGKGSTPKRSASSADPGAYGYQRAARDALHFAALVDRFIQNLHRTLGYDMQYFGAVEPRMRSTVDDGGPTRTMRGVAFW